MSSTVRGVGHWLMCMCWDGGRWDRPPGWEVRAMRSPGSAVTGGPRDLTTPPACRRSAPTQLASPSNTDSARNQGRAGGRATNAHKGLSGLVSSGSQPSRPVNCPMPRASGRAGCSPAWGPLAFVCPVMAPATGSGSGVSKTQPRAPLPTGLSPRPCNDHSMLQCLRPPAPLPPGLWPLASGSPL